MAGHTPGALAAVQFSAVQCCTEQPYFMCAGRHSPASLPQMQYNAAQDGHSMMACMRQYLRLKMCFCLDCHTMQCNATYLGLLFGSTVPSMMPEGGGGGGAVIFLSVVK